MGNPSHPSFSSYLKGNKDTKFNSNSNITPEMEEYVSDNKISLGEIDVLYYLLKRKDFLEFYDKINLTLLKKIEKAVKENTKMYPNYSRKLLLKKIKLLIKRDYDKKGITGNSIYARGETSKHKYIEGLKRKKGTLPLIDSSINLDNETMKKFKEILRKLPLEITRVSLDIRQTRRLNSKINRFFITFFDKFGNNISASDKSINVYNNEKAIKKIFEKCLIYLKNGGDQENKYIIHKYSKSLQNAINTSGEFYKKIGFKTKISERIKVLGLIDIKINETKKTKNFLKQLLTDAILNNIFIDINNLEDINYSFREEKEILLGKLTLNFKNGKKIILEGYASSNLTIFYKVLPIITKLYNFTEDEEFGIPYRKRYPNEDLIFFKHNGLGKDIGLGDFSSNVI